MTFFEWWGWDWLQVIACGVGIVAALLFTGRYWHEAGRDALKNPFGRFMLTRKALLSCFFTLVLINRAHSGVVSPDEWTGQDFVTALVFAAFALQTWQPYRLLMEARHALPTNKEAQRS